MKAQNENDAARAEALLQSLILPDYDRWYHENFDDGIAKLGVAAAHPFVGAQPVVQPGRRGAARLHRCRRLDLLGRPAAVKLLTVPDPTVTVSADRTSSSNLLIKVRASSLALSLGLISSNMRMP